MDKYEAGAFDEDAAAASTLQEYEARIAALDRLIGRALAAPVSRSWKGYWQQRAA